MSREIKFRAWDGKQMIAPDKREGSGSSSEMYIMDFEGQCSLINMFGFTQGQPKILTDFILMQYTGLKDKNGKEIYEGDIIEMKHPYKRSRYSGVVSWEGYMWSCKDFQFTHFDYPNEIFSEGTEYIKVVGNIYQHPELIK